MSLSTALSIAQSTLLNTSRQTTVVSRNVSEGSNANYARRSAVLTTAPNGAQIVEIRRATDEVLFKQNLGSTSSAAGQTRLLDGLNILNIDVYGVEHSSSPATVIGQFMEAMQVYSGTPSNLGSAESTVASAKDVIDMLNSGTNAVQLFRTSIDREIVAAVGELNRLLADFDVVNKEVVAGTKAGRDVNDAMDQRDGLLKQISEYVPISAIRRSDNDLMLVTKAGTTLFETQPREVAFAPIAGYSPTTDGNAVTIDGVPIAIGTDPSAATSGTLSAMLHLRDTVAGGMQAQLDEIARGMINAFAETDPLGVQPPATGLFTWPGAPALPAPGTLVDGLAGMITINAAFDSTQGGDPRLLRDGGANGAAYVHNASGGQGYSDLILAYAQKLEEPIVFDPAAGIDGTLSVADYSTESVSWLGAIRQDATRASENATALMMHTSEALSNATGVNIDEELTLLLDLEHTYEASARLMRTIDEMLAALMNAV